MKALKQNSLVIFRKGFKIDLDAVFFFVVLLSINQSIKDQLIPVRNFWSKN